ncbi:uncharacterized protein PAC_09619 [Phialocephala subalpina]|uniref:Uncharacterized protein n=1 Tax=Phialocephala subalpina TaxID=576137 RepID=A0A1L7X3W8_9HELO|nr:uncharacterized protein PAC_09619 [Phialocephala subalpina]
MWIGPSKKGRFVMRSFHKGIRPPILPCDSRFSFLSSTSNSSTTTTITAPTASFFVHQQSLPEQSKYSTSREHHIVEEDDNKPSRSHVEIMVEEIFEPIASIPDISMMGDRARARIASPPEALSRSHSESPTKRRDMSGQTMPTTVGNSYIFVGDDTDKSAQKKLKVDGDSAYNSGTSSETSPTATVANAFQYMSIGHETLSLPSGDIDTDLEKEWEYAMLSGGRMRTYTRVGKNGEDEYIPISYSQEYFVKLAKKIIRRYVAFQHPDIPYASKYALGLNAKIELPSDLGLRNFIDACKGNSGPVTPLVNLLRPELIEERLETFRCLVNHPVYITQNSDGRTGFASILRDLMRMFNRRLTFNVGAIRGLLLPVDDALLCIGTDHIFDEDDRFDTGGYHDADLDAKNEAAVDPLAIYSRFDELVGEFRWYKRLSDAVSSEARPKVTILNLGEEWNSEESGGSGDSAMPDLSEVFDEEKYRHVFDARQLSGVFKEHCKVVVHARNISGLFDEETYKAVDAQKEEGVIIEQYCMAIDAPESGE